MPESVKVHRVILNFTSRCNMACPYCYIPFDNSRVTSTRVLEVAEAIAGLRPVSVTVGGGDPFIYPFIDELLTLLRREIPFIQIDTNAKSLKIEHLDLIRSSSDLIGLPLDGSSSKIHSAMRSDERHFAIVLKWLERLTSSRVNVKVNTVLSKLNAHDLTEMGRVLSNFPIHLWSLYQFWPLEQGLVNDTLYHLDDQDYHEAVQEVQNGFPQLPVEMASIKKRSPTYFFVNHNGFVYTVDPDNFQRYIFVGSIFQPNIVDLWAEYADPEQQLNRLNERLPYV